MHVGYEFAKNGLTGLGLEARQRLRVFFISDRNQPHKTGISPAKISQKDY